MENILIVDDNITNLKMAENALKDYYKVTLLTSGIQALNFLKKKTPDLILLDVNMPNMDGFCVNQKIKENERIKDIPIIFLTARDDVETEIRALSEGVVDFIRKPFVPQIMLSRIRLHLEMSEYKKNLEQIVEAKTRMVNELQDAVSISIAELVECRDGETGGHIKRTKKYLKILANKMKELNLYPEVVDKNFIKDLLRAAPLHDIGKVGIKDSVLLKPSALSSDEIEYMKRHSILGGDTLQRAIDNTGFESFLYLARDMAYYHHEKWNGTGYPHGLKGKEIPLCARMMAIVDVYDALTAKRVYKEPIPHKKAVEMIKEDKGEAFDEQIVEAFLAAEGEFEAALMQYQQEQS